MGAKFLVQPLQTKYDLLKKAFVIVRHAFHVNSVFSGVILESLSELADYKQLFDYFYCLRELVCLHESEDSGYKLLARHKSTRAKATPRLGSGKCFGVALSWKTILI